MKTLFDPVFHTKKTWKVIELESVTVIHAKNFEVIDLERAITERCQEQNYCKVSEST